MIKNIFVSFACLRVQMRFRLWGQNDLIPKAASMLSAMGFFVFQVGVYGSSFISLPYKSFKDLTPDLPCHLAIFNPVMVIFIDSLLWEILKGEHSN